MLPRRKPFVNAIKEPESDFKQLLINFDEITRIGKMGLKYNQIEILLKVEKLFLIFEYYKKGVHQKFKRMFLSELK